MLRLGLQPRWRRISTEQPSRVLVAGVIQEALFVPAVNVAEGQLVSRRKTCVSNKAFKPDR